MLDIFGTILDVARSLLGMSDQLRSASRERRGDMAQLFDSISECLEAVATEIRAGGVPHGRCGELSEYARSLPELVAVELGEQRATELGETLHSAYNVERVAIGLQDVTDAQQKEPYFAQLEEASGKFRALASLVRAG